MLIKKTKVSFSGHDKFDCKQDWITRGLRAFSENSKIFLNSEIDSSIRTLGLGINMIKSLNHWMKIFGLIYNEKISDIGKVILKNDLYLESVNSLWLLHWNLVKNKEKTTLYYLFFNKMYPYRFSKNELFEYVLKWIDDNCITVSHNTIKSDIDVFLRTYISDAGSGSSMFSDLNILSMRNNTYTLNINNTTTISDDVFYIYYTITCYCSKKTITLYHWMIFKEAK